MYTPATRRFYTRVVGVLFSMLWLSCLGKPIAATAEDQIFLPVPDALNIVCGVNSKKEYLPQNLSSDFQDWLESSASVSRPISPIAHFYRCSLDGSITGYALIDQEVGKHLPMTYIVGITPVGKVSRVELMVYREHYGVEVKQPQFMRQFDDKDSDAALKLGGDIKHVTGATISSRSISIGVKRALVMWKHFFGKTGP